MIDIHCHILPGVDDGPVTPAEAAEMVRMAAAAGTTEMVATPHANERWRYDPESARQLAGELQQAIGETPRIHVGCELHVTPENIEYALCAPDRYSIAGRGYVLVEFADFMIPKTTSEIFSQMRNAGLRPIIAHPERNPLLQGRAAELEDWIAQGCLLQLTAQSFFGRFGKSARAASLTLLNRGMVHFVASDAHDTKHRPPVLTEVRQFLEEKYEPGLAERILVQNPQAVLAGVAIGPVGAPGKKKGRFALW